MKYYAIIVAGGSGSRMKSNIPKQFLLLNDLPVVMHTLLKFSNSTYQPAIILVLHPDLHDLWKSMCEKHHFITPHVLVKGGEERFHSVKNGLAETTENSIIAIHDAVRPLLSTQLIDTSFERAKENGNAVPIVKPSDSVRKVSELESKIINRDEIALVQTPQTFASDQLITAYQQSYSNTFTDDASVVEKAGFKINLIDGERNNFKITYEEDLKLASLLIK